jgi:hypothetical protein
VANRFQGSYRLHDKDFGRKHVARGLRIEKRLEAEARNLLTLPERRSTKRFKP